MCGLCFIYLTNKNKQLMLSMLTKATTVLLTGSSFDAHGLSRCHLPLLGHAVQPPFALECGHSNALKGHGGRTL